MSKLSCLMLSSCLLAVLSYVSPQPANANTAISFVDGSLATARYSMGYEFTPTVTISVTDLGYYDAGNDGMVDDHPVGIFRVSDQFLVASTTVLMADPALGNSPDGIYRYHALGSPVTLSAGTAYRIAGVTYGADAWAYAGTFTSFSNDPFLTLGNGFYDSTDFLIYPTLSAPPEFYATSNFLFEAVPEPASLGLLVMGGACLLWRRR